jgi:hypothetical protein
MKKIVSYFKTVSFNSLLIILVWIVFLFINIITFYKVDLQNEFGNVVVGYSMLIFTSLCLSGFQSLFIYLLISLLDYFIIKLIKQFKNKNYSNLGITLFGFLMFLFWYGYMIYSIITHFIEIYYKSFNT